MTAGESGELQHLRAEARFAREKLALYRAKSYGMRETSPVRMRELQRRADQTAERLAAAERAAGSPKADPPPGSG